jgi:hypothetical protein
MWNIVTNLAAWLKICTQPAIVIVTHSSRSKYKIGCIATGLGYAINYPHIIN